MLNEPLYSKYFLSTCYVPDTIRYQCQEKKNAQDSV